MLSFNSSNCSSPTHSSKTKFYTKVLCLLSFKKAWKKFDQKFYLSHTVQNEFLTVGAPLSFNSSNCSSSTHSSKTKFCTKVLCLLSFKKVRRKMIFIKLDKSQTFLEELFSLVKSSSKPLQKHACKRKRPWELCSQTLTSFLKKAWPKTLSFAHGTKRIFNRWCSVVV